MKWIKLKRLLKEPLLHFLLIGAALFLLYGWRGNSALGPIGPAGTAGTQIVVTQDAIARINSQFAKTWQRPPSEEEQKRLVEDFIRNEIFYREALAAGLDRDDEVLKRRLRQRLEFMYEDISALAEPTDEELRTFMATQGEKYLIDPQVSFRQIFINVDQRGKNADADARRFLAQVTHGADPDGVGDATLLEPEISLSPLWRIRQQFGEAFSQDLLAIQPGRWAGPIRSSFGLHLILVRERLDKRQPELSEAREKVKQDWMAERQKALKDAAYAKIRERYTVTVEKPKAMAAPLATAATEKVTLQ